MIRAARIGDAAGIAAAHVASWRVAYTGLIPREDLEGLRADERVPAWQQRIAAEDTATWVAEADGAVVGLCHIRPSEDPDDDPTNVAELAMLYLAPEAWGRGYGRELMESALAWAGERAGAATLWVLDGNLRARHFYVTGGWRDDGGRKDCFGGVSAPAMRYRVPLTGGVRAAGAADGVAIAAVNVGSWNLAYRGLVSDDVLDALDEEQLAREWAREAVADADGGDVRLWAVERDGHIVGYCRTGPAREPDLDHREVGDVYGLYLDPAAFGTGAATDLFSWAVGDLARRGFRRAVLHVVEGNARARRFYERQGWKPVEKAPAPPFHGAPQVRYAADLQEPAAYAGRLASPG